MTEKRLPDTTYKAEYPWNATHVSRSGHEFHIDDTPGNERLRQGHKAGTYWEISPDGRRVTLIVADEYHYVKGGLTLTVDDNYDVKVAGNMRLVIEGDCYTEVHGDMVAAVGGDSTIATVGDSTVATGGDSYAKVQGSMHTSVEGNMNAEVKKDLEASVDGDVSMTVKKNIEVEAKSIRIKGKEKITLKAPKVSIQQG